jgi:hypothetical protein
LELRGSGSCHDTSVGSRALNPYQKEGGGYKESIKIEGDTCEDALVLNDGARSNRLWAVEAEAARHGTLLLRHLLRTLPAPI